MSFVRVVLILSLVVTSQSPALARDAARLLPLHIHDRIKAFGAVLAGATAVIMLLHLFFSRGVLP